MKNTTLSLTNWSRVKFFKFRIAKLSAVKLKLNEVIEQLPTLREDIAKLVEAWKAAYCLV